VITVLIVEDDANIRAGLKRSLVEMGYDVRTAATGLGGLSTIVDEKPDVVLLDLGLPDIDGVDLLRMLRAVSTVPVVVVTARDDEGEIIKTSTREPTTTSSNRSPPDSSRRVSGRSCGEQGRTLKRWRSRSEPFGSTRPLVRPRSLIGTCF